MRDALGLERLLWCLGSDGIDLDHQAESTAIGKAPRETPTLRRLRPGTIGYRAAIVRAYDATDCPVALERTGETGEPVRQVQRRARGGRAVPTPSLDPETRRAAESANT